MLTVFIATHNGGPTLPRVLDAYARLLPPAGGWKLVLIDNGSDDDTAEIAGAFADRLPMQLMAEPRRGKNRALNAGLRELEGDLAVFSDDDALPDPEWLLQLRAAADRHPECDAFGGPILPAWEVPPDDWVRQWVPAAPVFGVVDAVGEDGPCDPTRIWGTNMAVRAEWFRRGYRFDERLGPNGSATYSMGGETEFTLRLAIAERIGCWRCRDARVHHIIRQRQMTRAFVFRRAFHLGRCVRRESTQRARAGQPHVPRDARSIWSGLARGLAALVAARRAADPRRAFEARWQLCLWSGCLYEALGSRYEARGPIGDVTTAA
ncbi:MAG TPA: glycosyltransferase [Candidatus Dormibacteraeota bacterium]|nr:glycosyltransferase [Candidatus Dormibacteraeota bacterium]